MRLTTWNSLGLYNEHKQEVQGLLVENNVDIKMPTECSSLFMLNSWNYELFKMDALCSKEKTKSCTHF